MSRRCDHCGGRGARHDWKLQACADQRRRRVRRLCTTCDLALNRLLLEYFNDPEVDAKMQAYNDLVEEGE